MQLKILAWQVGNFMLQVFNWIVVTSLPYFWFLLLASFDRNSEFLSLLRHKDIQEMVNLFSLIFEIVTYKWS